jgi:hypothetical protein
MRPALDVDMNHLPDGTSLHEAVYTLNFNAATA